jgi:hypothetical protein
VGTSQNEGAFAFEVPEIRDTLCGEYLGHLTAAYLKHGVHEPTWVGLLLMDVCKHDRVRAMAMIRALVAEAKTDEELAYIGAGLLEDLLCHQGPEAISLVEEEAATDSRFRFALAGVWPSTIAPNVWTRVTAALGDQPRY